MSTLYSRLATLSALAFAVSSLFVGCGGSGGNQKDEPDAPSVDEVAFARGADVSWASEMEYDMEHNPARINGSAFKDSKGNTGLYPVLKAAGINAIRLRVWVKPEDLKGLSAKVAEHTKDVLTALKSAGVTPHWVQVGNETRPGMLWETGRLYNDKGDIPGGWSNYAALTTAGYDAVKSVFPDAQVIVHIDNAYQDNTWFFDKLKANGGKFDMIGLSHYPMTNSQMTWKAMNSAAILNIKTLASKYGCKVMVCEVGVKAPASEIATSTQCLTDFMNSVKSLSVCAGVFYWEPQVDGKWRPAIYEKQGRNWGAYDMGAFTSDGSAITPTSILSAFGE